MTCSTASPLEHNKGWVLILCAEHGVGGRERAGERPGLRLTGTLAVPFPLSPPLSNEGAGPDAPPRSESLKVGVLCFIKGILSLFQGCTQLQGVNIAPSCFAHVPWD